MKYEQLTVFLLQTPGREFLLRVSYLEIYNEVCCIPADINFTVLACDLLISFFFDCYHY